MGIAGSAINNVVKSVSTPFDNDYRALVIGAGGAIGSASDALTQDGATARIWIGKPFLLRKK
jgi:shikimate 5-dehydrogenase